MSRMGEALAEMTGMDYLGAEIIVILGFLVFTVLSIVAICQCMFGALKNAAEAIKIYHDHMDDKIKGKK